MPQTNQHLGVRSPILLLCLVLLCTFVYVRMYVSVCSLCKPCLEDTRLIWCLSYPSGGTIDPWTLCFLVVREIDCGDWLARGYMPAHQHCDLFYPLVRDLLGSAINKVMLLSSGPGQVLRS